MHSVPWRPRTKARLAAALIALAAVRCGHAEETLARDSECLSGLMAEVQKLLPSGWWVEMTPDVPHEVVRIRLPELDWPHLVVWYTEKVRVSYPNAPNPPARTEGDAEVPDDALELVAIRVVCRPAMTPDAYRVAMNDNRERLKRRERFEARLRRGDSIRYGFMGPAPIPPWAFEPRGSNESESVRQYSFLWMETEPIVLPTHRYQTLSMTVDFEPHVHIHDAAIAAQKEALQSGIGKLLTAYEP